LGDASPTAPARRTRRRRSGRLVAGLIGRQLHLDGEELGDYAVRSEARHEHLAELRRLYGFRSFSGGTARWPYLPSKRLYVFDRAGVPKLLRPLVGGKVTVDLSTGTGRTSCAWRPPWPPGPCGPA